MGTRRTMGLPGHCPALNANKERDVLELGMRVMVALSGEAEGHGPWISPGIYEVHFGPVHIIGRGERGVWVDRRAHHAPRRATARR